MWKRETVHTLAGGNIDHSNSVMVFHQTCSSILSCLSSAASTASKNSSSLIRLLGPSCENHSTLWQPCKIYKQGFCRFLHSRNNSHFIFLHLYLILAFSLKNPDTKCLILSVKPAGDRMMLWGWFGVGQKGHFHKMGWNLRKESKITHPHAIASALNCQQNSNPKNTSKIFKGQAVSQNSAS